MNHKLPVSVEAALRCVLDYLWHDEAAHCLETSPLDGREQHIFYDLVTIRAWLDEQPATVAISSRERNEP